MIFFFLLFLFRSVLRWDIWGLTIGGIWLKGRHLSQHVFCDVTSSAECGTMFAVFSLYKSLCSRLVSLPVWGNLPLHQIPLARLENIWQQGIKKGTLNFSWIWGYRHFCGITLMFTGERFGSYGVKFIPFSRHSIICYHRVDLTAIFLKKPT